MDVMQILPVVAVMAVAGLGMYMLYDFFIADYFKKQKGLLIRVSLFERIGNDLTYIGERVAEEINDKKLGHFIKLRKGKIPIERIGSEYFTYDMKYGKHISLIKYAQDDYRPLVRLKDQVWYKKEQLHKTKTTWVQDPDNPAQKQAVQEKVYDKDNNPVIEEINIPYSEPFGITKDDRSAMRFNLAYHKRMEEIFGEKAKWYEKMVLPATIAVLAIVLLLGFGHYTNKYSEDHKMLIEQIGEETNKFYANTKDSTWMENFVNSIKDEELKDNAPPR